MCFLHLACINFRRTLRYVLPFVICFGITLSVVIAGGNVQRSGEEMLRSISESYIVTVEPIHSPPVLLSGGRGESVALEELTLGEILHASDSPYVAMCAYSFGESQLSPLLWEIGFDPDAVTDEPYRITDRDMLRYLKIRGAQNTQYLDSVVLVEGEHISDDTPKNGVLITKLVADLHDLHVGDALEFPLTQKATPKHVLAKPFTVIGIIEMNEWMIYLPASLLTDTMEIEARDAVLLNDCKFVLSKPDTAGAYIAEVRSSFQEKQYILQADDDEYKREIYPIEMILQLTQTLYFVGIFVGVLLLFAIVIKSSLVRSRDIAVLRLLSCKSRSIAEMFFLEIGIEILCGTVLGVCTGGVLCGLLSDVLAVLPKISFSITGNEILIFAAICLSCIFVAGAVFFRSVCRKPTKLLEN